MVARNGEHPTGGRRTRRRASGSSRPTETDEGAPRSLSDEVQAHAEGEAEEAATTAEQEEALDFAPNTPATRLAQAGRASGPYEREYRLQLLHRLLLRRIPIDQIADQLEVSVQTVSRDRQELYKRLRTEAKKLDIHSFIGDTMGFYNEITAMALRGASAGKTPLNIRLAALRTALASRDHMVRFLGEAGVLDALKFVPEKNEGRGDLEKMVDMTNKLLQQDMEDAAGIKLPENETGLDEEDLEDIHLL